MRKKTSPKKAPKKNRRKGSQSMIVRQLSYGVLSKAPQQRMHLAELLKSLEGMVFMKLRSDHLYTCLNSDRRFAVSTEGKTKVVSLKNASTKKPTMARSNSRERKLSVEEFTLRAIEKLEDPRWPGRIHSVATGFNRAFREYFSSLDPVKETQKLAEAGKISLRICRGGAMLSKPKSGTGCEPPTSQVVLAKMDL